MVYKRGEKDASSIFLQSHLPNNHLPKPLTQADMSSIKQFFSAHAKLYPASMVPEPIIKPGKVSVFKNFFKSSPWVAKAKAAKAPAPPAGETKYTLDHEMDALNLWSPWAAKSKAAKGMTPLTDRELETIKNKSWSVERRA
jgi:hypothetical protein